MFVELLQGINLNSERVSQENGTSIVVEMQRHLFRCEVSSNLMVGETIPSLI